MKVTYNITQNKFNATLNQETTEIKVKFQTGYYPLPGGGGGGDTSNLVPYTGANKDVNIGAHYFESSAGFKTPNGTPNQALTANGGVFDLTTKLDAGTYGGTAQDLKIDINNLSWAYINQYELMSELRGELRYEKVRNDNQDNKLGNLEGGLANKLDKGTYTGNASDLKSLIDTKADLVDGKVPASQLPSFVDDVLEFSNLASFPATGENGKIYIAIDTNLTYRWGGSSYVVMSSSLALGETSSTAYRGDRGKIAYDHSQATGNPHNTELEQLSDVSGDATTIIDTDVILKKETGGLWKKLSWSNIKYTLKTYFDSIYAPKAFNLKITTPSSYVTGILAETEVLRIEIPANSISNNSFLNMPILYLSKIGKNGAMHIKGKLSTSPTMPTGVTDIIFGYTNIGATNLSFGMDRMYIISDGLIKGFTFQVSSYSSSSAHSSSFGSKAFDRTVTNYLYVSIELGNTADQARLEGLQLTNS